MSKHMPPIPPASVSPKGTGGEDHLTEGSTNPASLKGERRDNNLSQQGQQANTKQNTTNQGLQQDR